MAEKISRSDFLRRFIKPLSQISQVQPQEPDYLSMLPPEFTDAMLKEEIIRLGENPEKLTKNQMAGLVLGAMSNQARG